MRNLSIILLCSLCFVACRQAAKFPKQEVVTESLKISDLDKINGEWKFKSIMDRGGSWSEATIKLIKINEQKAYGIEVPKEGEASDNVIVYTYLKGRLIDNP